MSFLINIRDIHAITLMPIEAILIDEILRTLTTWGINTTQQAILLSLPESFLIPGHIQIQESESQEVKRRFEALLAIDQAVYLAFPHTAGLTQIWLTTPNPFLDERTPLEVMLCDGLNGIEEVQALIQGNTVW